MTDEDARVAREVIIDELKTINKYEGLRDSADSEKVKDTLDDIIDEEKLHVGEASELLRRNDSRAMPALKEGASEVTKSFREVYAEKRGEVVAKAMGVHFEKYQGDRYFTNDEGEEVEVEGVLPGSDDDGAGEFPDKRSVKELLRARLANNKGGEKDIKVRNAGKNRDTTGYVNRKGGLKEKKGRQEEKPLTNEEIEELYRSGELETKPREEVKGMDSRKKGIGQKRSYSTRSRRDANREKNDFGITPKRAKKRGNDMDKVLSEKKEALDQTKPARIDLGSVGPLIVSNDPTIPLPDPDARLFEELSRLPPELRAEAIAILERKRLATEANQLKGREPSAVQQAQSVLRENMGRNDMVIRDDTDKGQRKASKKKASASDVPQVEGHMEKAGRRNDSKKQWFKNNDRVVRGSPWLRQLKYSELQRPKQVKTPTGAYTTQPRDRRNEAAIPSGIISFTDDPADFDMDNYNRYMNMGRSRLPVGSITDENYRTLMGGTHQIVPRRVHVRDAKGNKVYDEKRVPVLDDKDPYHQVKYITSNGKTITRTEPNYKMDANGNIVYTTEMVPRYETRGRTVLTKRGKDLAFLQRYGGRLDVEWDPATRQWKPVGMELDERGNVPKEMFDDLADEDGTYDPDKVLGRFRQFGYGGKDNRYEPPDMTDIIDKYYRDAAYEQLVEEYSDAVDNGKANPNVPFEEVYGEDAISERAAALRAEDEAKMDEFSREASEASRGVVDRNNMDYEEAANRAQEALIDWLDREPYKIDNGYIIRQGENGLIKIPLEKIEAWVDANTQAAFEDIRRDDRKKMSADEAAKEMAAARVQRTDKALTDSLFREMAEGLGHEPSEEEESELWNKAHAYVEKMTPDQKDAAIKDLDDAYKAQFGEPRPGSEEYIKLARQRGANSIADIQRGDFRHLWAGANPTDAYNMSFQRHKDLQAEGERQAKMRELVRNGLSAIAARNAITNEAQRLANQDSSMRILDKTMSLLNDPHNKATIEQGEGGVPYVRMYGAPELEGTVNRIFQQQYLQNAGDPMDKRAFANFLRSIYRQAMDGRIYDMADDYGYTPEEYDELKRTSGEAQRDIFGDGSSHEGVTDDDIRNSLIRTLEKQEAYEGPHTQHARGRYDELSDIYNEEGHINDVLEAVYDDFLKGLRGKLSSYRGRKELYETWGKDGLDKLTAIAELPDIVENPGAPGSLSSYDVLNDIVYWDAKESGEPVPSYDLARHLQRTLRRAAKAHNEEGIIDEMLGENYDVDPATGKDRTLGEYIRSMMEASNARDSAEEQPQPQADAKPIQPTDYRKTLQDILSAPGMSRLKNAAHIYMTLMEKQGKTPEEITDTLVTALKRGKGETFDMGGTGLKHQNGSSQTQDMHVKKPENVQDITQFEYETGYDPENILEGDAAEKRAKEIEETLAASEFNEVSGSQTGSPKQMSAEEIMADKKKHGTGHFNSGRSKGATVGAPIDDLKPRIEKRPESKTEEQDKKPDADETNVKPTGKSVSFRDIYSAKRQKVLDKYHGI